jgi:hypothetical protein
MAKVRFSIGHAGFARSTMVAPDAPIQHEFPTGHPRNAEPPYPAGLRQPGPARSRRAQGRRPDGRRRPAGLRRPRRDALAAVHQAHPRPWHQQAAEDPVRARTLGHGRSRHQPHRRGHPHRRRATRGAGHGHHGRRLRQGQGQGQTRRADARGLDDRPRSRCWTPSAPSKASCCPSASTRATAWRCSSACSPARWAVLRWAAT